MTPHELEAVQKLKALLREQLGPRLLKMRVFGSRARGDARPDSDLDVMALVDRADRDVKRLIAYASADVMMDAEHPIDISAFVLDPERLGELLRLERRIALDIEREGIDV